MSTKTLPSPTVRAAHGGSNRWLVLVAMTGALSMVMLDQTVVTVALPSITRELPLTATGQQWVVNAYVLAMAALVALGGKLGDKLGGVTTFRLGVTTFLLSSALCGLAPRGNLGEPWLIAARGLQGVGAALMMPVSAVIVMGAFGLAERGKAMAIYAGLSQLFLALGPLVGGLLTEAVSWRAVFWLNVPVGVVSLLLVRIARPANVRRAATINPAALILLVAGLGTTVLAVQQAQVWSWTSPWTLTMLAVGLAATTTFVASQLISKRPLVDVRLFGRPGFAGDATVITLVQFGLLAVVLFSSIYSQELLGFGPMQSGVAMLAVVLPLTVGAQLAGRWYDRGGVRPPVLTGLIIATIGLALWTISLPLLTYWLQLPGMALTGLGIGMVISPTNTDALGRVAAAERSQASGLIQTVRQLGGTLGVAVIGAAVTAVAHGGSGRHHAADAITVGFAIATAVFALAATSGHMLLARARVQESGEPGRRNETDHSDSNVTNPTFAASASERSGGPDRHSFQASTDSASILVLQEARS